MDQYFQVYVQNLQAILLNTIIKALWIYNNRKFCNLFLQDNFFRLFTN